MDSVESNQRNKWDSVEVCSAAQALHRKTSSVVVDEGTEVVLSPDNERFSRCFARVQLESFADLQTLGLVPRKVPEETYRGAIRADDAATYKLCTESSGVHRDRECGCSDSADTPYRRTSLVASAADLRRRYTQIRAFNHPALARVLSDHYRAEVSWDDPLVAIAHKWMMKFDSKAYVTKPLLIAVLEDITIHRGATLTLEKDLTSLYASDIWIHRRARLVQRGGYVKIWASSVRSFLVELSTVAKSRPWALEH
jgi:hypothetical protein